MCICAFVHVCVCVCVCVCVYSCPQYQYHEVGFRTMFPVSVYGKVRISLIKRYLIGIQIYVWWGNCGKVPKRKQHTPTNANKQHTHTHTHASNTHKHTHTHIYNTYERKCTLPHAYDESGQVCLYIE